jgi:hypothetical protein
LRPFQVLQRIQLRPPLAKGFTNFWARTLATTSVGGMRVPIESEVCRLGATQAAFNGVGAEPPLRVIVSCRIMIERVKVDDRQVVQPMFSGQAIALDYRLPQPRPRAVPIRNGLWP